MLTLYDRDHSLGYDANQIEPIVVPPSQQSAGIPTNMTFGPSYFDIFEYFPDARYIFDIPFAYEHLSSSLIIAQAAYAAIEPENILALELGNEVNLYSGNTRSSDWTASDYVSQWTEWTDDIEARLKLTNTTKIWQAAAVSAETTNSLLSSPATVDGQWDIRDLFNDANLVQDQARIKSVSVHYYQTKIDDTTILQNDLMYHAAIKTGSAQIADAAGFLNELEPQPIPLVLGEVGSSLGNGSNDSPLQAVLGAALWQVDFMLHAMSVGVGWINYQSGVSFTFSLWSVDYSSPDGTSNKTNEVLAPFYAHVFAAEFIRSSLGKSTSNTTVTEVNVTGTGVQSDFLSAYAAYEDDRLAKIAVLNLQYWDGKLTNVSNSNCTDLTSSRPAETFTIAVPDDVKSVQKKTLTSPCGATAYANENITWGGVSWNTKENDGIGRQVLTEDESVQVIQVTNGTLQVSVTASEAAMLYLQYESTNWGCHPLA